MAASYIDHTNKGKGRERNGRPCKLQAHLYLLLPMMGILPICFFINGSGGQPYHPVFFL
jgi:hypothetical protein